MLAAATACWNQKAQFINNGVVDGLSNDNGGRGWFGTVQVGCDYQVSPSIVVGAFADYDWSGIKGGMSLASQDLVGEETLKSSWAAGGRIGWLPVPAAAGLRLGRIHAGPLRRRQLRLRHDQWTPALIAIGKHTYSGWFVGSGY